MTKTKKKIIIVTIAICIVLAAIVYILSLNPRVRMLLSVVHFTEDTLNDPAYIANGIDVMDLCRNYANADTQFKGKASFYNIDKLKSSTYVEMDVTRSFEQKRLACNCGLDILWINVGNLDIYAEDQTVYMVVPILGDVGYAFPTGIDLFMKMPDLTHDINSEWFHDNKANIINLMRQINIEETGNQIVDEDASKADEFIVTIPEGCGDFLWELLGMKPPKYDVVTTMYLSKNNYLRRMVIDLSKVLPGAVLTIDGTKLGTVIFEYELPENEKVILTLHRDPTHINYIDLNSVYYANNGKDSITTGYITWDKLENGFDIRIKDLEKYENTTLKARANFHGEIISLKEKPDVFGNKEKYLYGLKKLDWRKIRDDSETFMDELMEKMKKNVVDR